MNIEELKQSGRIIFECIAGSRMYNLYLPEKSDFDVRGLYVNPPKEYLTLNEPAGQIGDEKQDVLYYSLKRFFELVQSANPNLLEIFWAPQDCIKIMSTTMEKLIANRNLFISKKAYFTHAKYAEGQIKKCRGKNKKVHNPQPETMPKKEDFCWIIPSDSTIEKYGITHFNEDALNVFHTAPYRSIPLKHFNISLKEFHCAGLEHVQNTYRLYYYGEGAKGIFRGDDMLVTESIPLEDEFNKFYGLLIYNQDEYEKGVKDWHSYNDWMKNRNESRWIDQEKGLLTYDQKNLCHCMRLLISGENILTQGFPIVRFEGAQREYLMAIRRGEFEYEFLMEEVEKRMKDLEELYKTSNIPNSVNVKKIDELYRELSK